MITIGGHTYLKKVGFLWGQIEGFDADVADDTNRIRFYRQRDLFLVLKDEIRFRKLIESAKKSRMKIPYAKPVESEKWVLESGDRTIKVKETMSFSGRPHEYNQPPVRGQGAGIPSQVLAVSRRPK